MNLLGPDVATIRTSGCIVFSHGGNGCRKDLPHESLSPLILPICLIIGLVAALILFTIFSKGREARVRKKIYKSIRIFRGKADVGAYYLSEEFIEQLMLGKEYEFDEETLSEAGLTIPPDRKYRGEKFIGI